MCDSKKEPSAACFLYNIWGVEHYIIIPLL